MKSTKLIENVPFFIEFVVSLTNDNSVARY